MKKLTRGLAALLLGATSSGFAEYGSGYDVWPVTAKFVGEVQVPGPNANGTSLQTFSLDNRGVLRLFLNNGNFNQPALGEDNLVLALTQPHDAGYQVFSWWGCPPSQLVAFDKMNQIVVNELAQVYTCEFNPLNINPNPEPKPNTSANIIQHNGMEIYSGKNSCFNFYAQGNEVVSIKHQGGSGGPTVLVSNAAYTFTGLAGNNLSGASYPSNKSCDICDSWYFSQPAINWTSVNLKANYSKMPLASNEGNYEGKPVVCDKAP